MLLLSQWLFLIILTYNYYEIMSACQKSLWNFFDRAYPPSILKAFKIQLRPKVLIHQAFLRRFIQFEAGLFLAAARSRHGSDMPPACHSLPCRRFATLKLPRYSVSLLCSMDFLIAYIFPSLFTAGCPRWTAGRFSFHMHFNGLPGISHADMTFFSPAVAYTAYCRGIPPAI